MVEVQNITKCYGDKKAVDNISFTVNSGEILGFLGPNGAGKSTTMNIITGYLSSSSGTVTIDGCEILEDPKGAKSKIGYLPEITPVCNVPEIIHGTQQTNAHKTTGNGLKYNVSPCSRRHMYGHKKSGYFHPLSFVPSYPFYLLYSSRKLYPFGVLTKSICLVIPRHVCQYVNVSGYSFHNTAQYTARPKTSAR